MRVVVATASVVVLGVLVGSASASGSGSPAGGTIRFFAPGNDSATGTIAITGAIGDYGKTLSHDKNGKADANGNFVQLTLQKGSFGVDVTKLNAKLNKAPGNVNKTTCSFSFIGSGLGTLYNGTGLYKGISGTVTITVSFFAVGPRFISGKKQGNCDFRNSSKPLAQYGSIIGTGTVKFS